MILRNGSDYLQYLSYNFEIDQIKLFLILRGNNEMGPEARLNSWHHRDHRMNPPPPL